MVVSGRPARRAKRRVTADLYDFLTLPSAGDGAPADLDGPFRSNVRTFVTQQAQLPHPHSILSPLLASSLMTWRMAFRVGEASAGGEAPAVVELDVVEEDVPRSRSGDPPPPPHPPVEYTPQMKLLRRLSWDDRLTAASQGRKAVLDRLLGGQAGRNLRC